MDKIGRNPEAEISHEYEQYQKYCDSLAPFWPDETRQEFIKQGVEFLLGIKQTNPDTIVFTDTGARSAALFLKNLWERIFPGEKFADIAFISGQRTAHITAHNIMDIAEDYRKKMKPHQKMFSGKRILLVDEITFLGRTLKNTGFIIKEAFPDCTVIYATLSELGEGQMYDDPKLAFAPPHITGNIDLGKSMSTAKSLGLETGLIKGRSIAYKKFDPPPAMETSTAYFAAVGKNQQIDQAEVDKISALAEKVGGANPQEHERLINLKNNFEKLV